MPNTMNDLADLYGSLNIDREQEDRNLEAIMKVNSYLNNSLDLRNIMPEPANRKKSIDAYLSELVDGRDRSVASATTKPSPPTGACNAGGGIPLRRLLAQSFSYSSDSSASPHSPLTPLSAPQVCNRSNMFSYLDESPQSGCSSNFSPNVSHRIRASTTSEPGSPTIEDAILMNCQNNNVTDSNKEDIKDITLADLMNSLSIGGGSSIYNQLNNVPVCNVTRQSGITNPYMNMGSQQFPNAALLGMQQPSTFCGMNHLHGLSNNYNRQQSLSPLPNSLDMNVALQNALSSPIYPNLMENGSFLTTGTDGWSGGCQGNFLSGDPYSIEKAARLHRNAAVMCDATCTWSGQLPPKIYKNPIYSCKVFLGGVPWDVTELVLKQTFIEFGNIKVEWPGKESSSNPQKGYVYITFEHEKQVKALLSACTQDLSIDGNYYYKVSSRRMKRKDVRVQVIPWVLSDSNYVRCPSYQLDPAKTVFVGALHGMLNAEGLAIIMTDLFGGVVYAGIDTDKHKYPIGSGRVTFNNVPSYKKAVRAAFIEIKTPKFTKKVQVDPYLADSLCQVCVVQQGPYFCRDENCFKYFCCSCWQMTHPLDTHGGHKPLMRNPKLRTQTTLSRVI
ncbi:cytoplasmic polyadenylation element-binding protein 1 isoform X1 [Macrobrachium rosenbergii]|uniref:cytoplasmic polyadenylation element-binding protein 1 isoform X1 n=1 Tax=Macrobrachium rosenbergii TaxID=79674 RepID=UPI0034D7A696